MSPLDTTLDFGIALYLLSHGCGGDEDKAKLLCKACCKADKLDVVKGLVEQHKINPNGEISLNTDHLDLVLTAAYDSYSLYIQSSMIQKECEGLGACKHQ